MMSMWASHLLNLLPGYLSKPRSKQLPGHVRIQKVPALSCYLLVYRPSRRPKTVTREAESHYKPLEPNTTGRLSSSTSYAARGRYFMPFMGEQEYAAIKNIYSSTDPGAGASYLPIGSEGLYLSLVSFHLLDGCINLFPAPFLDVALELSGFPP